MFDVLVFLFEQYYGADFRPDWDTLSRKLSVAGFDHQDIDEALDWLADLDAKSEAYSASVNSGGLRVYAEEELMALDAESRGFLYFLEQANAITPVQRELVIDRLLALKDRGASIEHTKVTTLMVLWNQREPMDALLVEELLNHAPDQMH
ncbi:Smg protein [Chitinivorax tropicus]|uniref:Protein Smg homolog n=1 Tax=Chitinivorax tropicus TaxID=714531 RepID=A0A840MJJ9_9PROT|nr:DUF494 domain-containing protein [Chitinivorax tropicus]MBB5017349.1 Smg protein [Chitinivorax tropicus]